MAEWLRAVIAFGSGVAGLSVPYPHPHTTHDSILTLPVHPPNAKRSDVHPRAGAAVCLLTQLGFNLHDGGRFPARVQVRGLFIPHAEATICFSSRRGVGVLLILTHRKRICWFSRGQEERCLPVVIHVFHRVELGKSPWRFVVWCGLHSRTDYLGSFSHL